MVGWTPTFLTEPNGGATLVVRSNVHGISVTLESVNPKPGLASWLALWLASFLSKKAGYELDDEATFFYVVVGDIDVSTPNLGLVDGCAVLEAGVGGIDAGPADGVETNAALLVTTAISMLSF